MFFEARNEMAHVLLSTCDSLSFDTYENGSDSVDNVSMLFKKIYGAYSDANSVGFTNSQQWINVDSLNIDESKWDGKIAVDEGTGTGLVEESDDYGNSTVASSVLSDVVRERFIAYLAGGDESEADKILEKYHIQGGMNGISFAGTCVKSGKLYLKITYDIKYEWNMFGFGTRTMSQSCCSKIWK